MAEKRPTADTVILLLAGAVSIVIVLSALAVILTQFIGPDVGVGDAARALGDIINTVVGALIGYLAGTRRAENKKTPEE